MYSVKMSEISYTDDNFKLFHKAANSMHRMLRIREKMPNFTRDLMDRLIRNINRFE